MAHAWNRAYVNGEWRWYDADVDGQNYRRNGKVSYAQYGKLGDTFSGHGDWEVKYTIKKPANIPAFIPLNGPAVPVTVTATPTASQIYLNGNATAFDAYNIGGNNYFKLRDVAAAVNFGVDWDGKNNTISVSTSKGYTPG
jgi:hypothetical protein